MRRARARDLRGVDDDQPGARNYGRDQQTAPAVGVPRPVRRQCDGDRDGTDDDGGDGRTDRVDRDHQQQVVTDVPGHGEHAGSRPVTPHQPPNLRTSRQGNHGHGATGQVAAGRDGYGTPAREQDRNQERQSPKKPGCDPGEEASERRSSRRLLYHDSDVNICV